MFHNLKTTNQKSYNKQRKLQQNILVRNKNIGQKNIQKIHEDNMIEHMEDM